MEKLNCYLVLGIPTIGHLPAKEVTDELIEGNYLKIRKSIEEKIAEIEANNGDRQHIIKLNNSLEEINCAYNTLKTEKDRILYDAKYINKKVMNVKIEEIMQNEEKESKIEKVNEIETRIINKHNKALGVRRESIDINYDVKYQDKNVVILETDKIRFLNGGIIDQELGKYFVFFRKNSEIEAFGKEIYSKIYFSKMQEKEYRESLYKAINKATKEERKYVGAIEKVQDSYQEIWDDGEFDAVEKYEEIVKNQEEKEKEEGR